MTDKQIRLLLRLSSEEAKVLLDHEENTLYTDIQDQLVELVREYGVRLPLNCLQFLYYENEFLRLQQPAMDTSPPF